VQAREARREAASFNFELKLSAGWCPARATSFIRVAV
jgi:hypothetical protein